MKELKGLLEEIKHHEKLVLKISTQDDKLKAEIAEKLSNPHYSEYYFFIFVTTDSLIHSVEFNDLEIIENEVLFVLPNQLHVPKSKEKHARYYKLALDKNCLALLPKAFSFLINPNQIQKIRFDEISFQRVKTVLEILYKLLNKNENENIDLILSYLNSLFCELEDSYFQQQKQQERNSKIEIFIKFKRIINDNFSQSLSIEDVANMLNISTNQLYLIVKKHSGMSPKAFLTNQIILETIRKLHYTNLSIKELSHEMGFSDPDHFAKTFKKSTGKSISNFIKYLQK